MIADILLNNVKPPEKVLSFKFDEVVKSHLCPFFVIPAKAGIQLFQYVMDTGTRDLA